VRAAKFGFYEQVIVCAPGKPVDGELGAILGRAQNEDDGSWHYGVQIYRMSDGWSLPEEELRATGEFDVRETYYDGTTIEVEVDRQGRGRLRGDLPSE
jgi:hypothetical protein